MALTEAEAQARSRLIDVDTYDVFLDLTADPPTSHTEIRFSCREPGASTFAELTLAEVRSAVLNGQALEAAKEGRLLLPDLAAGNVLTVEGELAYSPSGRGLARFIDPADDEAYLAITCYPGSAADIFCCFDQPDLSAAMTFSLRAPAGWECVGNGQVEQRPPPGQGGVWRLSTMPAMRPFDVAMCAGPFVAEGSADRSVQVSVRRRRSLAGADGVAGMTWFGELALSAIDQYERVLGIACPFPSYDIVFVPELIALALSVPGLMLVHERIVGRLADHDDFATMVCAHEVAHLWFGSMVGMRWWDDVWLDEAIATYLSYSPATSPLPSGGGWTDFCYRDKERAYLTDALPTREPVSSPVASSAEALSRPAPITYVKGAAVIRQLAALIGDDALHAGFAQYLTRHRSSGVASLDDLVSCMSRASGRDLTAWADEWLRTPGASTLVPELVTASDGTIESISVTQDAPRTHVIQVGIYDLDGGTLRCRRTVTAEISGARTSIAELAGEKLPSALILNEGDLTYARIGFDEQTLQSLAAVAMDVGDPLTEAMCWNAVWHLVTGGALAAADLAELIVRRLGTLPLTDDGPLTRTEVLLERALKCADLYAPPSARSQLRERLADAVIGLARTAQPSSAQQRTLAEGFTASADQRSQLDLLRSWLAGHFLPEGLAVTASLRGLILLTLSTRALATDSDLDTLVSIDPLQGELIRATCVAARPDPASKEFAWARALASDGDRRLPEAYAEGIWRPGQEAIMGGYLDRYFTEVLPAITGREPKHMRTLARALFPSTLVGVATIEAGEAVLKAGWLDSVLANVVAEQVAIVRAALAAQSVTQRLSLAT